jgi:hypothetical protein
VTVEELGEMTEAESNQWISDADISTVRDLVAEDIANTIDDLSKMELREMLAEAMINGSTTFHTGRKGPLSEMSGADLRAELRHLVNEYWRQ